ncbi:MAG: RHS repeat-associated core domain-containing protein [Bacteroidota bacterium]
MRQRRGPPTDKEGNGKIDIYAHPDSNEVISENHYYPFGMNMNGSWISSPGKESNYRYNGKELNEDFGLNWLDYGARWYDASIARWNVIDPLAETTPSWNPYNYVQNTPMNAIDPDGLSCVGCGPNGEDYTPPEVNGRPMYIGSGPNGLDHEYSVDKNGRVRKEKHVEGSKVDHLHTKGNWDNGNLDEGVTVSDQTLLKSLANNHGKLKAESLWGVLTGT